MPHNSHFEFPDSWTEARALIEFEPVRPADALGLIVSSFAVHVRDHKGRDLERDNRTLEVHYDEFVLSQASKAGVGKGPGEAERLALETPYGESPREAQIRGHPGRVYDLGPIPDSTDIDPRSPAVVVWHEDDMLYLLASESLDSSNLLSIAASLA